MRTAHLAAYRPNIGDPAYGNVVFALNMNRAAGVTTPVDDGPRKLTLSRVGSSAAYAASPALFSGTVWDQTANVSCGISLNVDNSWRARGGQPWAFEIWVYPTSLSADSVLLDANTNYTNHTGWGCYLSTDGKMYNWCGPNATVIGGYGVGVALNTWSLLRWVWTGEYMCYILNNELQGIDRSFTNIWPETANTLYIGNSKLGNQGLVGYIGPCRFTTNARRESGTVAGTRFAPITDKFPYRGLTQPAPQDPNPNYASLAFRFNGNGPSGGTVPNDTGPLGLKITRELAGAYSTTQSRKNGTSWGGMPTSGRLTVPQSSVSAAGTSWTFDAAVYPTSWPSAGMVLMDTNADSSNTTGWGIYISSTGGLCIYEGRATAVNLTTGPTLTLNTWNRVRVAYDNSTGKTYFFKNGTLGNAGGTSGLRNDWGTNSVAYVLNSAYASQPFTGFAAEVEFYKGVCLSTADYTLSP